MFQYFSVLNFYKYSSLNYNLDIPYGGISKYTHVCRITYRIIPTYIHIYFIYDVSSPFGQPCLIYKSLYYP